MTGTALRIGIIGLGTVGASVARLLLEEASLLCARAGRPLELVAVTARDQAKDRGVDLSGVRWEDDSHALATADDIDLVVELIGGEDDPAKALCEAALDSGKHVVTANKALIAHHGGALAEQAETQDVSLGCEAAVTAAIPVLKSIRDGLVANRLSRIVGIMNGTCNYMLTEMEQTGEPFDVILKRAQELGYAEADPSFDVDGIDTAHKLAILTALAFGVTPDLGSMYIEGIRHITPDDIHYARELGYRIKLLGIAKPQQDGDVLRISQRVHPCMVPLGQPLANVAAEYNAVEVEASAAGKLFFEGAGAGGDATASAVLADIVDCARGVKRPVFGVAASQLADVVSLPIDDHEGECYLGLTVIDKPGVLASIGAIFASLHVSVKSCIQHFNAPGEPVRIAVITHAVRESNMQQALKRLNDLDFVTEAPRMIRIETL